MKFNIGCHIDGSRDETREFDLTTVGFAMDIGMELSPDDEAIWTRCDEEEDPAGDDLEALTELSDDSREWLNDNTIDDRPPFTHWTIEDQSLYLVADVDSAQEDDGVLRVADRPDYIMEVNDHGNATLYEVTYKEVWSVD